MKKLKYLLLVILILPIIAIATACQSTEIVVGGNTYTTTDASQFKFNWLKGEITEFIGTDRDIVVPSEINGRDVVSIGDLAFNEAQIDSVILPNTIKNIGNHAFQGSTLKTAILPESGVEYIGEGVFNGCIYMNNVVLPQDLTYINNLMFLNCQSLTSESFVIPQSVTKIGADAFSGCDLLTEINLPSNITDIGMNAFYGCSKLTSINIPDSITTIEEGVFYGCSSIEELIIPNSVTVIENNAFNNCNSLRTITLSNTLKSLGDNVFNYCSLNNITIPSTVESIGKSIFEGCGSLKSISVEPGNVFYDSRNSCNAIIETQSNKLIAGCSTTQIPNTVVTIGERSFSITTIENITIPSSVQTIENSAFSSSSLREITIPDTVSYLGNGIFANCYSLTTVNLPTSIDTIPQEIFAGCIALTKVSIPRNITTINNGAFSYCEKLSTIFIPNSVTHMGEWVFRDCENLAIYCELDTPLDTWKGNWNPNNRPVEWSYIPTEGLSYELNSEGTGYLVSGNEATKSLTEIYIPLTYNDLPVTEIKSNAFAEHTNLQKIVIPNGVEVIGEASFLGCNSLTSLQIPASVTNIVITAFSGCGSLEEIFVDGDNATYDSRENCNAIIDTASNTLVVGCKNTIIPDSVSGIGDYAFYSCGALTSIKLPFGVTNIATGAFAGCRELTSIAIPSSVTNIGYYAFEGCSLLTIYCEVESEPSGWDTEWNPDDRPVVLGYVPTTSLTFTLNGDNTGYIVSGNDNVKDLTQIVIPYEYNNLPIIAIADGGFKDYVNLQKIIIPNSIIDINSNAFFGCSALQSIIIPTSVTNIGSNAFSGCNALTIHCICQEEDKPLGWDSSWNPNSRPVIWGYDNPTLNLTFTLNDDNTGYIVSGNDNVKNLAKIVIPYEYNGKPVVGIADNAFKEYTELTNLIMLQGVKTLGNSAFYGCTSLTSIIIPDSVTIIGNEAFYACWRLTSVKIPSSVTSIGEWAFAGCINLNSVVMLEGITNIGNHAFDSCSALTTIVLPNSLVNIGEFAFQECSALTSIILSNSLTSIGSSAFRGCTSLRSITIPNSVTSIGSSAFYGCTSLTIYCERTEADKPSGWDSNWNPDNRQVEWGYTGN